MVQRIKIGEKWVGKGEPTFIIADAGFNHQGDIRIAKKLIDIATKAGADSVKFRRCHALSILTKEGYEKEYDNPISFGSTYGKHREALELNEVEFAEIKEYSESKGLIFLASPWDVVSADFLETLNISAYKIASADINNIPFLEHVARKKRPMIVSTGMSDMKDVQTAYDLVTRFTDQLVIMQCTASYPCDFDEINLNVLLTYQKLFDCPIGYSGHEKGIAIPIAAVAMGASVIERRFTIDRTMKGSDHAASLEPDSLEKLVSDIRSTEKAFGSAEKTKQKSEIPVEKKLKKSLTSAKPIMEGTRITAEHLTSKIPGTGIPPSDIQKLIGKVANRNIDADKILQWEYFN